MGGSAYRHSERCHLLCLRALLIFNVRSHAMHLSNIGKMRYRANLG